MTKTEITKTSEEKNKITKAQSCLKREKEKLPENLFYKSSLPYSSSKSTSSENTKLLDFCRTPHREQNKLTDLKSKEDVTPRRKDYNRAYESNENSTLINNSNEEIRRDQKGRNSPGKEYSPRRTPGNGRERPNSKPKSHSSGTTRLAQCPLCARQFAK